MTTAKQELDNLIEGLRQQRDELVVQLNLAKADARDELEALEQKMEHLRARSVQVGSEVGEASQDVWAALKLVGEEVKSGFDRIRSKL